MPAGEPDLRAPGFRGLREREVVKDWHGDQLFRDVRAILYMAALVATRRNRVIRSLYQRLLATGKPKKLALTTCMRKLLTILNAMVRTQTAWRPILSPELA